MSKLQMLADIGRKFTRHKKAGSREGAGSNPLTGFTAKIFISVSAFIVLMSAAFTAFFISHQHTSMEEGLINEGYAYLRLFANSSRLGVISENGRFIEDTVEGLLKHDEIIEVSVWTAQGKILIKKGRSTEHPGSSGMLDHLNEKRVPIYFKRANVFDFWAPVLSKYAASEAAMFFDEGALTREQVIGYVNIVFDASPLQAKLKAILVRGVITGFFFLLAGSVIAFVVARKVARPLNRLTAAVRSVTANGFAEDVSVETTDEIGRLAKSFNAMIAALKKRESENLQLEAQLRQSQKMEAVGQLAGGVAHEINNPINSIINFAQLIIDEGGKEEDARSYAERIISECGRISAIVKGLLAFSRDSVDEKRPIRIKDLVSDTLDLTAAQLRKDGTSLVVQVEDNPEITGNPYQIVQVFLNLINNSRYALNKRYPGRHENKVLKIMCAEATIGDVRYVKMVFRDHGSGIPAASIEKVMNPFFTTKPASSGTGLGLSISYGIIREHGGRFEISSMEGMQTTAEIYLPARRTM